MKVDPDNVVVRLLVVWWVLIKHLEIFNVSQKPSPIFTVENVTEVEGFPLSINVSMAVENW